MLYRQLIPGLTVPIKNDNKTIDYYSASETNDSESRLSLRSTIHPTDAMKELSEAFLPQKKTICEHLFLKPNSAANGAHNADAVKALCNLLNSNSKTAKCNPRAQRNLIAADSGL